MAKYLPGQSFRSLSGSLNPLLRAHPSSPGLAATVSDKVSRLLKRDFIRCVYQPGEDLTEKQLTDRYKGSRTALREAAMRLQNERPLRIAPNRGYFASPTTLQMLNDIYEFRAAGESAGAELAAARGAAQDTLKFTEVSCTPEGSLVRRT